MYVLLFSKARNIVFVAIVISHDYSLPLSKLFCLKGSLNLKERRRDFLVVFCERCTFRMVQTLRLVFIIVNFMKMVITANCFKCLSAIVSTVVLPTVK